MIKTGARVRRESPNDYTHGRIGEVVDNRIVNTKRQVRVCWTHEKSGQPITRHGRPCPVRTWVAAAGVMVISSDAK